MLATMFNIPRRTVQDTKVNPAIHVLSPHRDDAALVFGGTLLSARRLRQAVTIHTIFSDDIYIHPDFELELHQSRHNHPHIVNLCTALTSTVPSECQELIKCLEKSGPDTLRPHLARLVRGLEDKLFATTVGASLYEYHFRAACPQREYSTFDSPLREEDAQKQLACLVGSGTTSLLTRLVEDSTRYPIRVLCPCGIGGHPDHLIVARFAVRLAAERRANIEIVFGQDLPYAVVPEWFQRVEIDFRKLKKSVLPLEDNGMEKRALIEIYRSQFRSADIDRMTRYMRSQTLFIDPERMSDEGFTSTRGQGNVQNQAVEVLYHIEDLCEVSMGLV